MNTSVSVIVLTHNTRNLLLQCLAGFYDYAATQGWQVIVVDNASTDNPAEAVAARFPGTDVLRSERNLGFAGGNNLGLRRATGQVIFLLNSDLIVAPDTLRALADEISARPGIGALSPRLLTPENKPQVFAYGSDPRLSYLLRRGWRALLHRGPLHDWAVDHPVEAEWVSAACLCVRREVIEKVGLLDERFFLYFEDNDWCLRIRRAGWKVVYDPRWQVVHIGGAAQPQRRVANQIYYNSLVAFYAKHYGGAATVVLRLLLPIYARLMAG